MAVDALTGTFRGNSRVYYGALFPHSNTIEWNASFFRCGPIGYKVIEQDLSGDHSYVASKIKDHRKRCGLTVIEVSCYNELSWSVKGYPTMEAYQKREEPGRKDSADPARQIAPCGTRKEQRSERATAMQPFQRLVLEKHRDPYEQRSTRMRVIVDGALHPTLAIPGYELLRQYQTDLGFVLITNCDYPFEEAVSITLIAPDLSCAISTGTVGAVYYTFWPDDVEWIDADHFRLTCEDAAGDWPVTLQVRYIPVLSPAVLIKRRVVPPTQPTAQSGTSPYAARGYPIDRQAPQFWPHVSRSNI